MTTTDLPMPTDWETRDKQADITAAKAVIAGPVPLIPDPVDGHFTLPRGLFHSGVWHREGEVRELTGIDEEALAKAKDAYDFFSLVIASGVTRLGTVDFSAMAVLERRYLLGSLLIGEREQIFLKVVQASFGNEKVVNFTCSVCQAEQEMTLIYSEDFKPKEVADPECTTLNFTTSKGDVLEMRPGIGEDQEEIITSKQSTTPAAQNTIMLSRCITRCNNELIPDPLGFARKLSVRDRSAILDMLVAQQPTIDLDVTTNCAACGAVRTVGLTWGDFFRS